MSQEMIKPVLQTLFSLFKTIYRMARNVKANEERCRELTKRVESLEKLVLRVQQRNPDQIPPYLEETLTDLCHTLQSTEEWMMKYTQTKKVKSFFKGGSHKEKFRKLNEKLSESFYLLSCALQVEHGEKIDMIHDTLSKRGSIAPRSRAAIPTFSLPEPAPTSQALMPSLPQLGPSTFSPGINYTPYAQTLAFDPFTPQPVQLPNIGFPNNIYNPLMASQFSNFPNMGSMNGIPQYSSMVISTNGVVTCVMTKSFFFHR